MYQTRDASAASAVYVPQSCTALGSALPRAATSVRSSGTSGYDGCSRSPVAATVAIASVAFVVMRAPAGSSGRAVSWSLRPTGPSESAANSVCCSCISNSPLVRSPWFAAPHGHSTVPLGNVPLT